MKFVFLLLCNLFAIVRWIVFVPFGLLIGVLAGIIFMHYNSWMPVAIQMVAATFIRVTVTVVSGLLIAPYPSRLPLWIMVMFSITLDVISLHEAFIQHQSQSIPLNVYAIILALFLGLKPEQLLEVILKALDAKRFWEFFSKLSKAHDQVHKN